MNQLFERVKQGVVALAVGAIFTLIPFYFETSAMSSQGLQKNIEQDKALETLSNTLHNLQLQSAIGDQTDKFQTGKNRIKN